MSCIQITTDNSEFYITQLSITYLMCFCDHTGWCAASLSAFSSSSSTSCYVSSWWVHKPLLQYICWISTSEAYVNGSLWIISKRWQRIFLNYKSNIPGMFKDYILCSLVGKRKQNHKKTHCTNCRLSNKNCNLFPALYYCRESTLVVFYCCRF